MWISLYYLAFYVVMSGLFALSIYSLMRTVNPYEPDYQDQLKSPGTARVRPAAARGRAGLSGIGRARARGETNME